MRINKPVGSKDRLVEIFQKVNHVKLNENLLEMGGVNLNANSVLNLAFSQLVNKKLSIEQSNTQGSGEDNFVELTCVDPEGNNITFVFKVLTSEGDQDGVYTLESAQLTAFGFDSADGEETIDLDENGLAQFNQQYANELLDVVEQYADVEEPTDAEELGEAIKLIDAIKKDSYPYGGGNDRMQTGQNYGDKKPTNDKVRVKSPQLDKFIQEDIAPVGGKIKTKEELSAYLTQIRATGRKGLSKEEIPMLADEALYHIAIRLADRMLPMGWDGLSDVNSMWDYIKPNGGMTLESLKAAVKRAVNVRLKEEGYSLKDLGLGESNNLQEFDKPAMKLIQQAPGGSTAGGVKQLEEDMDKPIFAASSIGGVVEGEFSDDISGKQAGAEIEPFRPKQFPGMYDELPVDNEPVEEVSPEKRELILKAYDNLLKTKSSPTYQEVMDEIDRITGKKKEKTRNNAIPKDFEHLEDLWEVEQDNKGADLIQAIHNVKKRLGIKSLSLGLDEYKRLVKAEIENIKKERHLSTGNAGLSMNEISTGFADKAADNALNIARSKSTDPISQRKAYNQQDTFSDYINPELKNYITSQGFNVVKNDAGKIYIDTPSKNDGGLPTSIAITPDGYTFARGSAGDITPQALSKLPTIIKRIQADMKGEKSKFNPAKTFESQSLVNEEEKSDYPDPIGKKFKPKAQIKKKKKRFDTAVKLGESTDQDRYEDVVFLQGDEAYQPLEILDTKGQDAAMEYLKQWHSPGEHQGSQELGHGSDDQTYEKDGYIMTWNTRIGYIGLQYDMSQMNEEAEPNAEKGVEDIDNPSPSEVGDEESDEMSQLEKDNPDVYPEGWKEMDGIFMGPNSPFGKGGVSVPTGEMDGANDPANFDINQNMGGDYEPEGEKLEGGKADGKQPSEFNPDQILKGLKVELEHTDDPMIAIEIVMDHLAEIPTYYDYLADMEKQAGVADVEGGEKSSDKDLTDTLLGFKPHNVGDEIEGEEEEEETEETPKEDELGEQEDVFGRLGDILRPEKPKEEEPEEKLPEGLYESQVKLAKETLSNRNVPTGLSKKEATQILVKHFIK